MRCAGAHTIAPIPYERPSVGVILGSLWARGANGMFIGDFAPNHGALPPGFVHEARESAPFQHWFGRELHMRLAAAATNLASRRTAHIASERARHQRVPVYALAAPSTCRQVRL